MRRFGDVTNMSEKVGPAWLPIQMSQVIVTRTLPFDDRNRNCYVKKLKLVIYWNWNWNSYLNWGNSILSNYLTYLACFEHRHSKLTVTLV